MSFSIDQLRIQNAVAKSDGKRKIDDGAQFLSRRADVRGVVAEKSYSGTWLITSLTEFQDFLTFLATYRSSRFFNWTPPDESTAAKYKFQQMPTIACQSGFQWIISWTLQFGPGVP